MFFNLGYYVLLGIMALGIMPHWVLVHWVFTELGFTHKIFGIISSFFKLQNSEFLPSRC